MQRGDQHLQPRTRHPSAARASEKPSFITSTDAKSSSYPSGDILSRDCCILHVCLWVVQWRYFPRLFLFYPSNLFVLTDHISEGMTLENGILLLPPALSHICHITLLRRCLDLQRKMKPCSQLQFADSHFKSRLFGLKHLSDSCV